MRRPPTYALLVPRQGSLEPPRLVSNARGGVAKPRRGGGHARVSRLATGARFGAMAARNFAARGLVVLIVTPEGFESPEGPPGGFGGFGAPDGAPLHDSLMQDDLMFARYIEALTAFLDGAASEAALNEAIDRVVPVLGERLPAADVEALRGTIAARAAAIRESIPSTATCAKDADE